MKKIIFFFFLVISIKNVNAQDYYMNAVNGTTITTCRGNVMPSWQLGCSAFGYAAYCNNENRTVTFYSGNPLVPLNLSFIPLGIAGFPTNDVFYTESGFDKLTIINGPSIGSPTIVTLSGVYTAPMSFSTTGAYMTINFKSDGSVNDWGWFALLGCRPNGCGGNLPASDICANSPAICDLNGYCGSTNGWYTPDNMTTLGSNYSGPFCGSIENNSWIKFIPNSANASINVLSANCSSPTQGIQAAIMNSANCNTFAVLACQSQASGPGLMTLSYSSFVPGTTYYIMIDGYAGNACDYTVTANTGVAVSTINVTSSTICNGQNTSLTAVSPGTSPTYIWSTGSTASNITVAPNITTVYTATINTGFCSEVITKTITVNPIPTANAGTSPGSITCSNPTRTLTGTGGGTYSWSGAGIVSGGSTANPVVNGAGPYSLVVTLAGCTSTNVTTVSNVINTVAPVPATLTPNAITCGTPNINVAITASSGVTYNWSGPSIISGGTTSSPLVNATGNYNVLVTNSSNGCSANAVINVTSSSAVTVAPSTSGNVTCSNSLITLSTPNVASQNYTWTAPSGAVIVTGANSAVATGSNAGTYTVTVLNTINGCIQIGAITANVNTVVPTATASSAGTITCINSAISLNVNPSALNYSWTASGGGTITSGVTTQTATGNGNGTYFVVVTDPSNGCSVTKTITPAVNTATIVAGINSPGVLTCNTTTVSLTGNPGAGVSYLWAAPNATNIVSGNTLQTIGVNAPGTYTLNVINTANGCPSTPTTVAVIQTLTQPTISAATQTANLICGATSVLLSGSVTPSGGTYTWTSNGGGFTGATNNFFVSATTATVYLLTASHPVTGCLSSLSYTVIPDINSPTVTLSSNNATLTCLNTVFSTTATVVPLAGSTYSWSGPGIVGSTTGAAITATAGGIYGLTVTASNNCKSNVAYVITLNNTPVNPSASSSNTITCVTTSSIASSVSGNGPFIYIWSGPSSFTSSAADFTTSTAGVYNLTVTNTSSGCTGTTNINAIGNFTAPSTPTIAVNNITLTCASNATVLTASSNGATSYSWTAPSGAAITSGSSAATASVTGTGVFTVVAIGGNGCNTAFFPITATVTPPLGAPVVALSNSVLAITCTSVNPSATANTTVSGVTYSWSPSAGIAGSNTNATATFTQSGTYSVIVTNTLNNCSSFGNNLIVNVTTNNTLPNANAAAVPTINCTTTLVTISPVYTPSTNLAYSWSGANVVGTTTNSSVQTNSNTPTTVSFTNTTNGCVNSLVVIPGINNAAPSLSITTNTGNSNITCQSPTLNFNVTSTPTNGVSYLWSNGSTSPNADISLAGTYTLVATNNANNCQTLQTFTVGGGTTLPTFSVVTNAIIPCGSNTTNLNVTSTNTNVTYIWGGQGILNGATTNSPIVGNAGTYTLLVTDITSSCSVTQTVSVSNSTVVAQFIANPLSGPAPLVANFTNQSTGALTYTWNFGNGASSTQTNTTNEYLNSGTYTVVLFATNGACTSTASILIKVLESLGVIPEVFTPNGDLFNPTFEIKGLDSYPNNSLQIFNRWGNLVYKAKPYKNDWTGVPNVAGKTGGDKLPVGTYYYILDLGVDVKNPFTGYIQLQY